MSYRDPQAPRPPVSEAETIELFRVMESLVGWRIVKLQGPFPDAVIKNGRGRRLVAEFEYKASGFRHHRHDPAGCDLIICWCNDWPGAPLPVLALSECLPEPDPVWWAWAQRQAEREEGRLRQRIKKLESERRALSRDLAELRQDLALTAVTRAPSTVPRR